MTSTTEAARARTLARISSHRAIDAFALWLDSQPEHVRAATADMMAALMQCPMAVAAAGRALAFGAAAPDMLGPRPDRTDPIGHLRAAHRHILRTVDAVDRAMPAAAVWPIDDGDRGTGEFHAVNAAARLLLVVQCLEGKR